MNTEQERADFEAWFKETDHFLSELDFCLMPDGRYEDDDVEVAWEAYQAGRSALQSQAQIPAPTNRDEYIALLDRAIDMGKQLNVMWEEAFAEVGVKHGLQSQDGEKHLVAAIREAIDLLGPEAPICSGCEYEWNHALRVLREAIDRARRAEGGVE